METQFLMCKHKNMRVSMYFLHLVPTFTPHYIIMDKGQLIVWEPVYHVLRHGHQHAYIWSLPSPQVAMKLEDPRKRKSLRNIPVVRVCEERVRSTCHVNGGMGQTSSACSMLHCISWM